MFWTPFKPLSRGQKLARFSFSLLELLMVISIIAVLTALLVPTLKAARDQGRKAACASNLRQFGMAFRMYQNDHKGLYPFQFLSDSLNWQGYLCGGMPGPKLGPNAYFPSSYLVTNNGGSTWRIKGKYLCPEMVKLYNIPPEATHNHWGYTINMTRTDISYAAWFWPWFKPQYQDADLDSVYPRSSISAVLTCGDVWSWNSDWDWDAFTSLIPSLDWKVQKVHGNMSNVLFMDGHVESLDVTTTGGQNKFNYYWYNGIPTILGNPW